MFDIGGSELLMIAIVGLLVIGPKDLPKVLRVVGRYTGKARAMSRHLRAGFDEMLRQAELEEMEKQWAETNARIMAETPVVPPLPTEPVPKAPTPAPEDSAPVPPASDDKPTAS